MRYFGQRSEMSGSFEAVQLQFRSNLWSWSARWADDPGRCGLRAVQVCFNHRDFIHGIPATAVIHWKDVLRVVAREVRLRSITIFSLKKLASPPPPKYEPRERAGLSSHPPQFAGRGRLLELWSHSEKSWILSLPRSENGWKFERKIVIVKFNARKRDNVFFW